ncbi:hypothetical protein llap_4987 [Limosa lapponica baueri]|uniref:Uncharacterized protein n=1 Tax=Limosa lapponica baueri TaxID=1758121 RepID=A0A2I0UFB1_LIMLA|nr:hypothetical protein llap_4987 [Limosa lapponica baueri]
MFDIPQPAFIPAVALTQVQDPALRLVEPHGVHMGQLLKAVQVPLDGILSIICVNYTTQLGTANLLRVHSIPLSMSLVKILNHTGPSTNPSGTPLITDLHLDIELLTIQRFPHPPNRPSTKSISHQFKEKNIVWDRVKGLIEIQIDDTCSSSFVH